MFTRAMTAGALAGGLLMVMLQTSAQAFPAAKTDAASSSAVALAGHRGPGGGGGFRMGGGGGPRIGGGGGGHGFALRGGGGPRILRGGGGGPRFALRGNGPRLHGGGAVGVPRYVDRGGGHGPKGWRGPKFADDFKHHGKHHRRLRGFAYYGAPYVYYGYSGYDGCGWLYRNAIRTGDQYWWDRYYACRDGYYDY